MPDDHNWIPNPDHPGDEPYCTKCLLVRRMTGKQQPSCREWREFIKANARLAP